MNKNVINNYLNEINNLIISINNKKEIISSLEKNNNDKKIRNENKFYEIIEELNDKETKIKNLMDNKYFSYIQLVDFINNNNIYSLEGFEMNKNGCLVESFEKRTPNNYYNKIVNSNNTEIIYEFDSSIVYNELEYSFYNQNGVPIVPENIKIYYEEFEEDFYEAYFRYYNRFTSDSFINNFLFTPKFIKKIKFLFNDSIDSNNDRCIFYTNEYKSSSNNNYSLLKFSNDKKLANFNLYKNSHEDIPLIFSYSEDNINYTDLIFNNNETIFSLNNNGEFFIKIVSDYDNFKTSETYISENTFIDFSNIQSITSNSYNLNISGQITDIDIIFSHSSYSEISKKFLENDIDIENFIEEKDELYYLKKEFLLYIKEDTTELSKLKFYDDISMVKNKSSFFNIYINTISNIAYIPSFLKNYNFSFNISYKSIGHQIEAKYYTPMIFDISIKG